MAKLVIPAPGEEAPREGELDAGLWGGLALSLTVAVLGWGLWVVPQQGAEVDPLAGLSPAERQAREASEVFERWDVGAVDVGALEETERVRAIEYGPRALTEKICSWHVEASGPDAPEWDALALAVSRRSERAPWTCLVRGYLGERFEGELVRAMDGFWAEVEGGAHQLLVAAVVDAMREERDRPETERFYRWLRGCAARQQGSLPTSCLELTRQLSPAQGSDVLEMIDRQLKGSPEVEVLLEMSAALGRLAEYGQPPAWRVVEAEGLPDYDVDLRLGALFSMCRMMNSPDARVRDDVAQRLATIARVGLRPTDAYVHYRWLKTCRIMFGDRQEYDERAFPYLGVIDAQRQMQPRYAYTELAELGLCEEQEGMPLWLCGARRWTGGRRAMPDVLADDFVVSRYVEWLELDEVEAAVDEASDAF
ncbi:hypothetical protein FRC96_14535 [Lujinxingia vulgaris]|uniref:Uncharacterized protein n=1 Tax=Lujinxingia vulgaris TaxID=2600176 RepID=A0A5C6X7W0_9DELT|nr:hypothetical protein [Lujinxingia vulgaris]TXD34116.1 hypothetical protein FRC96_14535 [Lujinxingia vulgaris]